MVARYDDWRVLNFWPVKHVERVGILPSEFAWWSGERVLSKGEKDPAFPHPRHP